MGFQGEKRPVVTIGIESRDVTSGEIITIAEERLYRLNCTWQEKELMAELLKLEKKRGGIYKGRKKEELTELAEKGERFYE